MKFKDANIENVSITTALKSKSTSSIAQKLNDLHAQHLKRFTAIIHLSLLAPVLSEPCLLCYTETLKFTDAAAVPWRTANTE